VKRAKANVVTTQKIHTRKARVSDPVSDPLFWRQNDGGIIEWILALSLVCRSWFSKANNGASALVVPNGSIIYWGNHY
jgi:hypothetical protein